MRRTLSRRVALLEQQLFNIKMKLNVPLSKLELGERKTDPLQTIQMVCYYDTFCSLVCSLFHEKYVCLIKYVT